MSTQTKPLAFIIEDDSQLTDIFQQAMIMADFETQTIANGQLALDMLADHKPAVIILDIYLPEVSGDKILNYIRNDERLQKAIVILTSFDSLLADNLREQSDYVLLKPVSFTQLRDLAIRIHSTIL